jgi:hypothetical protein
MFDNLTREQSLLEINNRVMLMQEKRLDNSITPQERREFENTVNNEIRELWYHIYDLEGKPYTRE